MTPPNPQVRRATIEDLPQLVLLWRREGYAVSDLEKRFKEFQVIDAPEGGLAYVAYPPFDCVVTDEGEVTSFAKLTGSQRPVGLIFSG